MHFSASLHSHTTWGGDAAGGWGRTRGLGPPAAPPGTRGGPPARAAWGGHVCKLYLILPLILPLTNPNPNSEATVLGTDYAFFLRRSIQR